MHPVSNPNSTPVPVVMLGKFGDLISCLPAFQILSQASGSPVKVIVGSQYRSVLEGVSYVEPISLDLHWPTGTPQAREFADKAFGKCVVPQFWADPQVQNGVPYGETLIEIGKRQWRIDERQWPNYMSAMWQRLGFTDAQMREMPLIFDRRDPDRERKLVGRYIHPTLPTVLLNFTSASSPFGYEPEIMRMLIILAGHNPKCHFVNLATVKAERIYDLLGLFDSAAGLLTCATASLHLAAGSKIPYIAFTEDHWSRAVPKGNCRLNIPYSKVPNALVEIRNIVSGWVENAKQPEHANPIQFNETNAPSITKQTPWPCGLFHFGKTSHPQRPGTDYFNCGLASRPEGDWLVVRRSVWNPRYTYGINSLLAFALKDTLPGECREIAFPRSKPHEHFEDPRVFQHHDQTYISCTNFVWGNSFPKAHQLLGVADQDWKVNTVWHPIIGHNGYRHEANTGSEKNWLWFFHNDKLHLIYQTIPHTVVRWNDKFLIEDVAQQEPLGINWPWGLPRGGTPPVLVGKEYWSFFHSSVDWCEHGRRRYHMGAYAFEAEHPFRITRFSAKPILNGSVHDPWTKDKPLVVFPCGALLRDGEWFVTLGVNDLACGWIKIPHEQLVPKLVRVDAHKDLRLTRVRC